MIDSRFIPNHTPCGQTRREFLWQAGAGFAGLGLIDALTRDQAFAGELAAKPQHFSAKAKHCIFLFMNGGPSQVDTFDPKPALTKWHGKKYTGPAEVGSNGRSIGYLTQTTFKFKNHGQSGLPISDIYPHLSAHADELCVIRSMHSGYNGHEVSIRYIHSGIPGITGRPTMGSWLLYGLGSETANLPAYMVMTDPGGPPVDNIHNWSNGWMPSMFQGTVLRPRDPRILNLDAPAHLRGDIQRGNLGFLARLNRRHLEKHPGERDLEARIASYELAARMQTAAKEALDISGETQETLDLYGLGDSTTREYGTRCLIARRMVERGVRFVQLFLNSQPWDNHQNIKSALPGICRRTDKPAAALVTDLKRRGLLDTTIVHWGGEIGRLPVTEGDPDSGGRDHNGQGFSAWLAGGGFKPGIVYGETDEVGHRAAVNKVTANDFQATLLHQFGLDHSKLAFFHNGQEQTLTAGREARVVHDIIS